MGKITKISYTLALVLIFCGVYSCTPSINKNYLLTNNDLVSEFDVLSVESSSWSGDFYCADSQAQFGGETFSDQSAKSVAIAGDMNGDGYDDILIGAMFSDDYGTNAGKAYLFFGSILGTYNCSEADVIFIPEGSTDLAGASVAGAGDVNNDGYDDILIGAPTYGAASQGRVYIIFGQDTSKWGATFDLSNANVTFSGTINNEVVGSVVKSAGNVNGDEYDDILIYSELLNDNQKGRVDLIYGQKTSSWNTAMTPTDSTWNKTGNDNDDHLGSSLAGGGDINGDGYDDFLMGARGADSDTGELYVYTGHPTNDPYEFGIISGETFGNYYGESADIVGDVNDDGYDDYAVGATFSDNGSITQGGKIFLYLGQPFTLPYVGSFIGEISYSHLGSSISRVGDINGDGYDDFLAGAKNFDGIFDQVGKSYLICGRPTYEWVINSSITSANATFTGEFENDRAGHSISGTGDINGDGYNDILIGAYGNNFNAGKTYLMYNARPFDFTLSTSTTNPNSDGKFGLFWQSSSGAVSYSIYGEYLSELNTPTILIKGGLTDTSYSVSGFADGLYRFYVIASNSYGDTTSNSIEITVVISSKTESTDQGDTIISLFSENLINIILITLAVFAIGLIIGLISLRKSNKSMRKRLELLQTDINSLVGKPKSQDKAPADLKSRK